MSYCNDHVRDLRLLLSSNGDISFQKRIIDLATSEADLRFKIILGQEKISNDVLKSQNYQLARSIMSNVVFTIFQFWVQHYQTMSLDELRSTVYQVQQESLVQLMQSVLMGKQTNSANAD